MLVALVGVAVYLLAVFPTRSFLLQRDQVKKAETQFQSVQQANVSLQNKINSMNSPTQIERIARSQYGLVKPGEKAFVVLPPASTTTTTVAKSKS